MMRIIIAAALLLGGCCTLSRPRPVPAKNPCAVVMCGIRTDSRSIA